jgi:ectoine hydroxylase-related dioxygenase (phytanoyl-CoA dioxygenase family)
MEKPSYVRYSDPDFLPEFQADMQRTCPIKGADNGHMRFFYDTKVFDFRSIIARFLRVKGILEQDEQVRAVSKRLEQLHDFVKPEDQAFDSTQHNAVAVALYDLKGEFNVLYERFIAEVIVPKLHMGPVHYQSQPTFRVFFPNAGGYPGKTTYHSDLMLGHNPREVNVFLPFTTCEESRSLLMAPLSESLEVYEACDYDFAAFAEGVQENSALRRQCEAISTPLKMDVGEVMIFDARCLHAGPPNETDLTRMTMDFRLLPASDIADQKNLYRGTGRTKALFAPSGAFSEQVLPSSGICGQ